MNLQVLSDAINAYANSLSEADMVEWIELYDAQFQYAQHWSLEVKDVPSMLRTCYKGELHFWNRPDYYPVQAIIDYAELNDDMIRSMYSDLYNEGRDLTDRMNRFIDQCDEFRRIQRLNSVKVDPHWHDKEIVLLYLSFQYPDKYPLLLESGFRKLLSLLKARPLASVLDIERYVKTSHIIYKLMNKNEKFINRITELNIFTDERVYPNIQVVAHFYNRIGQL